MDPADAAPTPDEEADLHERTGLLRVCLERLAPRDRRLVQLKFVDELSYKEIAAKMGMTVGHVGYQLHHALKSLELELREEGVAK
jgi:RNA polymerase sigma-70 factor (ECF subfamily)